MVSWPANPRNIREQEIAGIQESETRGQPMVDLTVDVLFFPLTSLWLPLVKKMNRIPVGEDERHGIQNHGSQELTANT